MASIIYGGLDVHQKSIQVELLDRDTGEVLREEVVNERDRFVKAVRRWQKKLGGELRLCYEASQAGFVIKRWLDDLEGQGEHAITCEVIAPSLIPKSPGDRVKTDKRDAHRLVTLYQAGLLQPVRVPSQEEETVRALVRLMTSLTTDLTREKNRVGKYLRSLGQVYPEKTTWNDKHRAWIASLPLGVLERLVVETHLDTVDSLKSRRAQLERKLEEIARTEVYWPRVQRLMSLRGIGLYSAMVLLTEIGDCRRFGKPSQLMSYFGLVPMEASSGERQRRGSITKAGNSRARWILGEAAWNARYQPGKSKRLRKHWASQPSAVVEIAKKAERRLHDKYWKIAVRKDPRIAATAVAREMVGFVWSLLTLEAD
jgi:transposase